MNFQRSFDVKAEYLDQYTFLLVAYGINYQSEITINGNFVGRHIGGYSSFVLPIPNNTLQVGSDNTISIMVNNELNPRTTLPLKQQIGGWKTYGGIFRDIYILAVPKLFIEDAVALSSCASDLKSAKFSVKLEIADRWSGMKSESGNLLACQIEIFDKLTGELAGRSGLYPITPKVNKTIYINPEVQIAAPKLWSPDTPDLYNLKCQIVNMMGKEIKIIDEYSFDYGVRDIQWKDGKLSINDKQTQLRGISWHEDHTTFGSSMTYEAMERDVASMKTLGTNLVRFLYPPHPYMLNLCDRYGILVMEEIPNDHVPLEILSKDYFQETATNYVKEMVQRDRKHVSVLGWGIGNEIQTTSSLACEFINGLRNVIKSLDKRNVYFASQSTNNACFEYVDMIAVNSYGVEPKQFKQSLASCVSQYPQKPVIVSRYGVDVEPGNHNGYSDLNSLEAQARYAMLFFNMMKEVKIAGSVLWSYSDWRTDRPSLVTRAADPYLVSMGVVGFDREKRPVFDVVRALFNDEKVQALPVGNYSSNTPIIYVISGFLMLILFAFMYNANRRFRDGINRSLFRTYNFFADVRDQRIISNFHSFIILIVISITCATVLSSIVTHYRSNILFDNLLSQFLPDGLKESAILLIWNPAKFILIFSGIIILKLVLIAFVIKLFSMLIKTRVMFYHAFSVSIWSTLPYIILIPIGMILFRLMETEFYILPVFIILGIITLWVSIRLLKGISIIYDVYPGKVYTIGIFLVLLICVVVYGYLDYTQSTSLYLKYLYETMR
ncbi:MAG: hypothetical protein HY964_07390 [Ignavibacteriales bacterium]|nr:hypothetical protein [Ignavibacteriales bacterium]